MKPEEYDVVDETIRRVNWILDRMPKIDKRLDDINRLLIPCGTTTIPVKKWCELVNERSTRRLELKRLEEELKEKYHLSFEESEKLEDICTSNIDL